MSQPTKEEFKEDYDYWNNLVVSKLEKCQKERNNPTGLESQTLYAQLERLQRLANELESQVLKSQVEENRRWYCRVNARVF